MNKVALITGAASGIGYEFSKLLFQKGYNLALIDINEQGLAERQDELKLLREGQIYILKVNLADKDAAQQVYQWVKSHKLFIHILFNNAGFGNFGYFADTGWSKDEAMLQVHITTTTRLIKLLLPDMLNNGEGKILNNASVAAFVPGPFMAAYHASKAYLLLFSQALAYEVKNTGVTVTVLCPGMTRTGFAKANGNEDPGIKFNLASAQTVAHYAFKAMMKGKVVAIPGFFNKLSALLSRLLPAKLIVNVVGNIQRKNRKKYTDQPVEKIASVIIGPMEKEAISRQNGFR